jgi:hypothetical protein
MSTPPSVRKACEALYEAMAELDTFEDRQDPASPTICRSFKECLEMLHELAAAKGFVTPSRRSRHSPSLDQVDSEEERNQEKTQEGSEEQDDPPATEKVGFFFFFCSFSLLTGKVFQDEPREKTAAVRTNLKLTLPNDSDQALLGEDPGQSRQGKETHHLVPKQAGSQPLAPREDKVVALPAHFWT